MSPEKINRRQRMLDLAKSASKVSPEELHRGSRIERFGNNFYLLFLARRIERENPEDITVNIYLRRAEALDRPWRDFLERNTGLLLAIDQALQEAEIYFALMDYCTDLGNSGQYNAMTEFMWSVDPQFGLIPIGMAVWDKLNPLLEQAAGAMQQVGINPQEFSG